MSEDQNVPRNSEVLNRGETVFGLAAQIEALLAGHSNRMINQVMNAVGSLHGIRCISADRPIGQVQVSRQARAPGSTTVDPAGVSKPRRGIPPAAWKQTDEYSRLTAARQELVSQLKAPQGSTSSGDLVNRLREVEAELKKLRPASSKAGF